MQPGRQRFGVTHRGRFAGQDQERRLKGILRLVNISQDAPAHVEHERAMTNYQRRESRLIPGRDEAAQECGVTDLVRFRPGRQSANVAQQRVRTSAMASGLRRARGEDSFSDLHHNSPTNTQNGTLIFQKNGPLRAL